MNATPAVAATRCVSLPARARVARAALRQWAVQAGLRELAVPVPLRQWAVQAGLRELVVQAVERVLALAVRLRRVGL
jgi:hypothetical protein